MAQHYCCFVCRVFYGAAQYQYQDYKFPSLIAAKISAEYWRKTTKYNVYVYRALSNGILIAQG